MTTNRPCPRPCSTAWPVLFVRRMAGSLCTPTSLRPVCQSSGSGAFVGVPLVRPRSRCSGLQSVPAHAIRIPRRPLVLPARTPDHPARSRRSGLARRIGERSAQQRDHAWIRGFDRLRGFDNLSPTSPNRPALGCGLPQQPCHYPRKRQAEPNCPEESEESATPARGSHGPDRFVSMPQSSLL